MWLELFSCASAVATRRTSIAILTLQSDTPRMDLLRVHSLARESAAISVAWHGEVQPYVSDSKGSLPKVIMFGADLVYGVVFTITMGEI